MNIQRFLSFPTCSHSGGNLLLNNIFAFF